VKAAIAPIMDVLRPSRKENVIGNARPNGNVQGAYGVDQPRVWNPADRTRTTIKEQTIDNNYEAAPTYNHGGGYATNEYQPIENQRMTTNVMAIGGAGATSMTQAMVSQEAERNAYLNPNKEVVSVARTNIGNMSLLNSNVNMKSSKIGNVRSAVGPINMPKMSSNVTNMGQIGYKNNRDFQVSAQRSSDGQLLNAFNNNPYTHSLHSVA
jgi:hypothetical protein